MFVGTIQKLKVPACRDYPRSLLVAISASQRSSSIPYSVLSSLLSRTHTGCKSNIQYTCYIYSTVYVGLLIRSEFSLVTVVKNRLLVPSSSSPSRRIRAIHAIVRFVILLWMVMSKATSNRRFSRCHTPVIVVGIDCNGRFRAQGIAL